jgi:hypothetical protein
MAEMNLNVIISKKNLVKDRTNREREPSYPEIEMKIHSRP